MDAVNSATYELELSLMKIAQIMQDSKRLSPGSKIVYIGPLPTGIAEVYYEYSFEDNLNVRFFRRVDLEKISEIGSARGYHAMFLPEPTETREIRTNVYDQNGKFVKRETSQEITGPNRFKLTRHEKEHVAILEVFLTKPDIVSIGKCFKLRWPGKGPVSNKDALEILEQYRHEIYDDN